MDSIIPCRRTISDRFPVASFRVRVPEPRYYEVACATDPRLFHPDQAGRRRAANFYTSRDCGLIAAQRGEHTWMMPPEVLRSFAGARRIYYALGTYAGKGGEAPRFSIAPETLGEVPAVSLASDFTGRTLDRGRIGRVSATATRSGATSYGNPHGTRTMRWGGDDALEYEREMGSSLGDDEDDYDDGYDPDLWSGASASADDREDDSLEPGEIEDGTQLPAHAVGQGMTGMIGGRDHAVSGAIGPDPDAYGTVAGRGASARVMTSSRSPSSSPVGRGVLRFGGSPQDDDELEDGRGFFTSRPEELGGYGGGARAVQRMAYGRRTSQHAAFREHAEEESLPVGPAAAPLALPSLGIPGMVDILRRIGEQHAGPSLYRATTRDPEFRDPKHPAFGRYHLGLSWGLALFNQRTGALGRVLRLAAQRDALLADALPDAERFASLFGPDHATLLERTDARITVEPNERVAPIAGARLWESPWIERFEAAGAVGYVQAAQNEVAVEELFAPLVPLARALGVRSGVGLALLVDRAVHLGAGEGASWIMRAVGPVRTEADRARALQALGYGPQGLQRLQREHGGDPADGRWGPLSHAAMTSAMRRLGSSAPLRLPTEDEVIRSMLTAAEGTGFRDRMLALRDDERLAGTAYDLT